MNAAVGLSKFKYGALVAYLLFIRYITVIGNIERESCRDDLASIVSSYQYVYSYEDLAEQKCSTIVVAQAS